MYVILDRLNESLALAIYTLIKITEHFLFENRAQKQIVCDKRHNFLHVPLNDMDIVCSQTQINSASRLQRYPINLKIG